MRALVLAVTTPDAAEVRVEVALVDENGQPLVFDALKAAASALLGEETGCSLKYVDSDGDTVTIASDADVREASEYMQDEGLERLAVKVIPHRNLVKQHVKGIVAAVAKLAQKIDLTVTKKPTVKCTFELLLQVVSEWDVSKDVEVLTSLKADLIKLLSDKRLSFAVEELSQTEKYAWIVQRLIEAIHKELPLEEVIAGRWDEAVGFGQEVLLRCPELSRVLVHVTEACITSVIAYNKKLQEEPQPPKDDSSDEQTASATTEKEGEEVVDVVHEGFRCDSCSVGPIVGPRYRSLGTKDFDLCHTCHKSRPEFESTHGPFERVVTYKPIHFGVVCDGCEASPILGIRYKSYNAHDFDLCESYGTVVAPDVDLVKSWKVKNTGASAWPEGCQLKLQTGRCGVAPFEGEVDVTVPPLNSGEEYIAEVQIRSPSEPGRHRAYWRMCDGEGKFFGHRLWIDLEVSEDLIVPEIVTATVNESECVTESDSSSSSSDEDEDEDDDEGVLVSASSDVESVASSDVTSDTFSAIDDASTASEVSDEDSEVGREDEKTAEIEDEDDEDIVEELYKDALVVLEAMGFGDKDQNRRTLAEWGGNLADAVNSLLQE
ncbi:hypothetical protein Poli38472_006444 [Pythium oligandrum]|uniref:ZZ-type domain-containing protein n=1 Tax=Pythium oligandrum TaxID=41045 RepID=A0A8K1C4S5_PYTOL|nr:hypothetical protein Poli38472_006444 [Pythium oligandrum]|eukprot:TMW56434.1 hypothetical protein Poli38472_006444 [Pythium oligandrum]